MEHDLQLNTSTKSWLAGNLLRLTYNISRSIDRCRSVSRIWGQRREAQRGGVLGTEAASPPP